VRTEVARVFFRAEHGREPMDAPELAGQIAKDSRPRTQTVAGYDLTFSPVKSVSTVGDAYDNGLMESVIGLFKTECIRTTIFHAGPYKTLADVEYATAGWVDWYNDRRLNGSIGMVPPAEYEQAHFAALNPENQPV